MSERIRTMDIETTGTTPGEGETIEAAWVDVVHDAQGWRVEEGYARLYRPLRGIPAVTRAVHHIGEADIPADAPVCTTEQLERVVWHAEPPTALVAHNAAFESAFIPASVTRGLPWICTYKVALRVLPDAPAHTNQTLRYFLDLPVDPVRAQPPHRALPDAYVTAHLLMYLLGLASLEQMIAWSSEPKAFPRVPFGKHRGSRWSDVEAGYLAWMARTPGLDADAAWCARRELERRASLATPGQAVATDPIRRGTSRFGSRAGGVMRTAG